MKKISTLFAVTLICVKLLAQDDGEDSISVNDSLIMALKGGGRAFGK